jgi:hypothetical protein
MQGDFWNENPMLGMLIMSCIRGLEPFWWNSYAQYAAQAVNFMPFTVEKCVSFCWVLPEKQSFKIAQSHYSSHQFGYPASAKSMILKSVKTILADRRYEHIKQRSVRESVKVCTSHCRNLNNRLECLTVVVTKQWKHCNCFPAKCTLFSNCCHQWTVKIEISTGSGCLQRWRMTPTCLRCDLFLRWGGGTVPSYRLWELSEESHMINGKSPCSRWNCSSLYQDWSVVCSVSL